MGVGNAPLKSLPKQRHFRFLSVLLAFVLTALALPWILAYLHSPSRGLPYSDSFANGHATEWRALGGTWAVVDGAMRNDSDERGAKLITGSTAWRNYSIEADVMLLGQDGDAGLIIRSSDEEEGVDSYMGYYAGLRNRDNSLVLGHADHGWMETLKYPDPGQGRIQTYQWYHLKLLAYDCEIAAAATSLSQGVLTSSAIIEKDCVTSGRVGLRSYASGGAWKNVVVRPATQEDLKAMLAAIPSHTGSTASLSPPVSRRDSWCCRGRSGQSAVVPARFQSASHRHATPVFLFESTHRDRTRRCHSHESVPLRPGFHRWRVGASSQRPTTQDRRRSGGYRGSPSWKFQFLAGTCHRARLMGAQSRSRRISLRLASRYRGI